MSSLDSIVARLDEAPPAPAKESAHDRQNRELRERSGKVDVHGDRLTSFLYDLLRDHLLPGQVERLVRDAAPDCQYTNGHLARYAKDLADRLRKG